mmetsp:Transcript_41813/g.96734  ORF Transcript_41813/g.96734 Transcript_41813/m.96734 type:complete len:85 (+) Transcript_41813:69-323(+)
MARVPVVSFGGASRSMCEGAVVAPNPVMNARVPRSRRARAYSYRPWVGGWWRQRVVVVVAAVVVTEVPAELRGNARVYGAAQAS